MFFPGETITHRFIIPFDPNEIDHVVISYKQNEAIIFEKTITSGFEEISKDTTSLSFTFTQDEGLLFADNSPFTMQCNVFTKETDGAKGGTRHTSHEMSSSSGIQYLREVMRHGE